jgi:hypothetical protein
MATAPRRRTHPRSTPVASGLPSASGPRPLRDSSLFKRSRIGVFVLSALGLALAHSGSATAQGGANCLFQCDSQCYGQQGPYCRSGCMARCNSNQNSSRPNARPGASFGAIAATATTGDFYGYSFGWPSQAEAEREALANCNRQAGSANACMIAVWFSNSCAALAIGSDGAWGADWAGTSAEASAKALRLCRGEDDSGKCAVVKSFCSPQ